MAVILTYEPTLLTLEWQTRRRFSFWVTDTDKHVDIYMDQKGDLSCITIVQGMMSTIYHLRHFQDNRENPTWQKYEQWWGACKLHFGIR